MKTKTKTKANTQKKYISLLLSLIIALSVFELVPFSVSAEDTETVSVEYDETSGTTGDCVWRIEGSTLIISGSGEMEDYSPRWWGEDRPWYGYRNSITSVIINNGVTKIGECAFTGCGSLKSVTISKSVKRIEGLAFAGCEQLEAVYIEDLAAWCGISFPTTSYYYYPNGNPLMYAGKLYLKGELVENLNLPANVVEISDNAFYGCTSIKSADIPQNVTAIGDYAFYGCSNLQKLKVASGLKSSGYRAFCECDSLSEVIVSDLAAWCDMDFEYVDNYSTWDYGSNPLFNQNAALYINDVPAKDIVIPDSVTNIKPRVFYGVSSITSVSIPDSVESIGDSAFSGCTGLTDISFGKSVSSIGEYAFSECKELTSIKLGEAVTTIGQYAFYDCKKLNSIIFPVTIAEISYGAFFGTPWYNDLPDENIYINKMLYKLRKNDQEAVTIKNGTLYICSYAAYNNKGLMSIIVPDSVTTINRYAFYNCENLLSVSIPDSVTSIGDWAFGYYYDDNEWTEKKVDGFTIYGYAGSAAEDYALANGFSFIPISDNPALMGDADGNGAVDTVDATIVQRFATKISVPYSNEQLMCADIDGDGYVTVVDATFIQRYDSHVKTPYPIGEAI